MKVIIATDSFKGSLTSLQAGNAIREGIIEACGDALVKVCPIADGGEGTTRVLIDILKGNLVKVKVHNPIGKVIDAYYGVVPDTKTAVIEMSAAAGLTLVEEKDRNPMDTTTYGVGEMIKDAIERGYRNFIVGIGGSATNDGGTGMLKALGFDFKDNKGKDISLGAKGLKDLARICFDNVIKELYECNFKIACDVKNPLCGTWGCSKIFALQKGATVEMAEQMDKWLENYAGLTKKFIPDSDADFPGAGAAGGMGFAFMAYLKGNLVSGLDLVMEKINLEEKIQWADIVVTGEGKIDEQSTMGKVVGGVSRCAKKHSKKVIAFCGICSEEIRLNGVEKIFSVSEKTDDLNEVMKYDIAYENLKNKAKDVFNDIDSLFKTC